MNEIIFKIRNVIRAANRVAILPHVAPDGDAIGSSFAIAAMCEYFNTSAVIFTDGPVKLPPGFPCSEYMVFDKNLDYSGFDTCIAVDCGDEQRIADRARLFENALLTVNIDHHPTNTGFALHNLVDHRRPATGELVYNMYKALSIPISPATAYYLYYAIATDTGCFSFPSADASTFRAAADLMDLGAPTASIITEVFESKSVNKIKLTALLIDTLRLYHNGKTAIIYATTDMLKAVGADENDLDDAASIPRSIQGVCIGVLLKQRGDGIKVSLRSKGDVDVSGLSIAFGGGGHRNAAGFTIEADLDTAIKEIVKKCAVVYRSREKAAKTNRDMKK